MSSALDESLTLRHAGERGKDGTYTISLVPRSFRVALLFEYPCYVFLSNLWVRFLVFSVPRVIAGLFSGSQPVLQFVCAGVNEIEGDRLMRSPNSLPSVTCARRLSSSTRGKVTAIVLTRSPCRIFTSPFTHLLEMLPLFASSRARVASQPVVPSVRVRFTRVCLVLGQTRRDKSLLA